MARCSALLLLLLFWAGAPCGAQEGPPPADLTGLSSTLDLLWSGIGRIVRSAVEPPIARLDGRLTGVQVQLNSVSSELENRVESAEMKLEARVESAEAKLEDRVGSAETKLEARVESAETKLEDRVGSAETKLEARVESAETKLEDRVESAETKLEARVESAETKLEDRVESAETKLEARVESAQKQLENRMDGIQSEQTAQTLELTGRLSQIESTLDEVQVQQRPARDCSDLPAGAASGVHLLQPGLRQPVPAYCDQNTDGGGWTLIQRRADIKPRQDFFLGWAAYKWGFGELDAEFWWGLENIWLTTSLLDRRYQLRIDMEDFEGEKRYAVYQGFRVASEEDGYRLTTSNYTGNAGDSIGSVHSSQRFSTKDQDQDASAERDCADEFKGGWWYESCHWSHLNGRYLSGNHSSKGQGVIWYWKGSYYSLKSVEMKIKPSKKL